MAKKPSILPTHKIYSSTSNRILKTNSDSKIQYIYFFFISGFVTIYYLLREHFKEKKSITRVKYFKVVLVFMLTFFNVNT